MSGSQNIRLDCVHVDKTSRQPLFLQIHAGIRAAILDGTLASGDRLPATRELASRWDVSRSTVVTAFQHLVAEGYLVGRPGAGTEVAQVRTTKPIRTGSKIAASSNSKTTKRSDREREAAIANRGREILKRYTKWRKPVEDPIPFRPGVPAAGTFPSLLWRRLTSRCWRELPPEFLAHAESPGYAGLRHAVVKFCRSARAIKCSADQVFIVSSTQHAIALAAQVLLDAGDGVLIEDPGYPRAHASFVASGATLVRGSIDAEGMQIDVPGDARLAYVTPAHQYPMGVPMSIGRRLSLLDWARTNGAWIIEDDYASEFRYSGPALESLQSLSGGDRVVYLGTFSKVFSPALRLGFIIVPKSLVESFRAARSLVDRCPSLIDQAVLAEFISDGHYDRHVRRMRMLYSKRRAALCDEITNQLKPWGTVEMGEAGFHVLLKLHKCADDHDLSIGLSERGIVAPSLSSCSIVDSGVRGLLLGFAGWDEITLRKSVQRLANELAQLNK